MNEPQIVRPYAVIVDGRLEIGLEALVQNGRIVGMQPHTGLPEPFILTPAFVNAHSHLEYRGLQGKIHEQGYWNWIRKITQLKTEQTPEEVVADCLLAAEENHRTGVYFIEEHTDRPGSASAMTQTGIQGVLYQEVITFFERESPEEKLSAIRARADKNQSEFSGKVLLNPHAYQTVDRATLSGFSKRPVSIHVAETDLENQLTRDGSGEIAEFYRQAGFRIEPTGLSVVATLDQMWLAHDQAQFVHCCAISEEDILILANKKVRVAHCPRSNKALGCPPAPVREMLDSGIEVGLGLDSAASSGPIDMFDEMRAALETALYRGRALSAEEVWRMATGSTPLREAPLLKIHQDGCHCTEDILSTVTTKQVEWLAIA